MEHGPDMMNQILQYGALGILALVIFFGLQMMQKASDRNFKAIDALTSQLGKLDTTIHEGVASQERRFSEAQRLLDRFESALEKIADSHKDLVYTVDKNHAAVLARIEESAKDTRHSIKNDLQLLFIKVPKPSATVGEGG